MIGGLVAQGGRAAGRALFLAVCALGLATIAQGAWVPVKAAAAQVLLNRAFDAGLASRRPVRPWPWADTAPVARVSVPRLGLREVVLSGGSGQALAFGPTRLRGNDRVTVLAAHRDTHFRFVPGLRRGDRVILEQVDGSTARYRVIAFDTVRWDRFAVPRDPPRRLLALATCAGPHSAWRRIAWAEQE